MAPLNHMDDSVSPRTKPHSHLPPRAVPFDNSPSTAVDAHVDFSQIRYASTPPPSSPPPSLWPERIHSPRQIQETLPKAGGNVFTFPESPVDKAPNLPAETDTRERWESTHYTNSISASYLAGARVGFKPRIEPRNHYPDASSQKLPLRNWKAYPHPQAPEFTYDSTTTTTYGKPPNPLPQYLKQSHALQQWMCQKIKEMIFSRNKAELQAHKRSAAGGIASASLEDDSLDDLIIKLKMTRGGHQISEDESHLIREILDKYAAFVDITSYESLRPIGHCLSETTCHPPKKVLWEVERLLGSDGSIPCKPDNSQSYSPDSPTRHSSDEAAFIGLDNSATPPKRHTIDDPVEVLIPDWFPVFEAEQKIKLVGETPVARWKSLLNHIWALEVKVNTSKYQEEHPSEEGVVKNYKWDQVWHNPNPGWKHEKQRRTGGWWKCRSSPDAPMIEQTCKACRDCEKPSEDPEDAGKGPRGSGKDPKTRKRRHSPEVPKIPPQQKHPQQNLDEIMKMITGAMREVANADKAEVLARMGKKRAKPDKPLWM